MKNLFVKILILFVLFIPLWSFLTWFFWPGEKLNTIILDKTGNGEKNADHRSFNWILTHEKYTNNLRKEYDYSRDYLGYHPAEEENYRINDLEQFSHEYIDSMTTYVDMAYFVDAEGVVREDWPEDRDPRNPAALIYGGISAKDYYLLESLFRKYKLIVSEYNTLGLPTEASIRRKLEDLYQLDYSGWTGRYFPGLGYENPDIPSWIKTLYRERHNAEYLFEDEPGIILLHEDGNILVLQLDEELELDAPLINTPSEHQKNYKLPPFVEYNYWFEINRAREDEDVISYFKIHTNEKGDSLLAVHGIPQKFPAVIGDHQENLRYYFCGDFAENPVKDQLVYFKGIDLISSLFYDSHDRNDRKEFFWKYYHPLIDNIIKIYKKKLKISGKQREMPVSRIEDPSIYNSEELLEEATEAVVESGEVISEQPVQDVAVAIEKDETGSKSMTDNRLKTLRGGRMPTAKWQAMSRLAMGRKAHMDVAARPAVESVMNPAAVEEPWLLVLGSFQNIEHARTFIRELAYDDLQIIYIDHLKTHRVSLGTYPNLLAAQQAAATIRDKHPEAWMIKV